jgi:hypothetical protein
MSALHEALKTLGPADFADIPLDDLKPFISDALSNGQLLVDSVPIPPPSGNPDQPGRRAHSSNSSSSLSSASEISSSSARSPLPRSDVEVLQKEWKPVKVNPKENPLGINVYKLGAKDGKGTWFARRSVHEGLGFAKWKRSLEREFSESIKVEGVPGEGSIRGIGGERMVENESIDGLGKMKGMS